MAARFTVDPKGTVSAESSDGRRALAAHQGTYALVPTHPDWLCLIRSPPAGGPGEKPKVVLAGDAAAFAVSDFIAFLGQSRFNGVLRLHAADGERSIHFNDGDVRGASSENPADRLGEVMIRLGYVSRNAVEEALKDHPPSKVGRALVEKGVLQAHEVFRCVTQQVSDIFHTVVTLRQGAFVLVDQEVDEKAGQSSIQLSTQSLLMDSVRQVDEMAHFRKKIPHGGMFVQKKRPSDGKLEAGEDKVLALVDGERTVLGLGQAAKLSEFDVTKIIYRLLEGGYVGLGEKKKAEVARAAPAGGGRGKDAAAMIRVFNFIFREIRDEMGKQRMEKEFIAAANAALVGQALSSSPVLAGLQFGSSGALPEDQLLKNFDASKPQLGSEPLASLKQALSDVMFFLLFQAGELLESRADEDLARRVKELLATIESD